MKKLFAALMLVTAVDAHAGPIVEIGKPLGRAKLVEVMGGVYLPDTTARWFRMTNEGYLMTQEQGAAPYNYAITTGAISATMLNTWDAQVVPGTWTNRDSTAIFDLRGFNRVALFLHTSATSTSSDSLCGMLLALQQRGHYTTIADSQSTFRVMSQRVGTAVRGMVVDSIGSLGDLLAYTADNGRDGMMRTRLLPSEKAVVVSNPGSQGDPRGQLIWSTRINEPNSATPPYVSWRLRAIQSYTCPTGGNVVTITDSSKVLPVRVTLDVVRWRE